VENWTIETLKWRTANTAAQPIADSAANGERQRAECKMKRLLRVMAMGIGIVARAGDESQPLSLTITLDQGIVIGSVRNGSDVPVKANAEHLYGWWEFTQLSYFDGSWHEAPLVKTERVHIGATRKPVYVILQPGAVLVAPQREVVLRVEQAPPQTNCTFRLDLADYQLPKDVGNVSKLRVEARGLTATLEIENPNKALLGDAANRARER
jgi:hypothetical protein